MINVTIVYSEPNKRFWDFLCGRTQRIVVKAELIPISPEYQGDYTNDTEFREKFQSWITDLWFQKDQNIKDILGQT